MTTLPSIGPGDLMHGVLARAPFSREGWIFEIKYDGYRAFIRKSGERVELFSRHGTLLNASFPDIVEALEAVSGSFVWDAELTVDESNGRPSFERLQLRSRTRVPMNVRVAAREHPARLYVFDILALGQHDLRQLPLSERKEVLRECLADTGTLVFANGVLTDGRPAFDQTVRHDLEGLMAKRLDSIYRAGRSADWLKFKNSKYSRPAALGFGRS